MAKAGVGLSGCGCLDEAEIFESVATRYHRERAGAGVLAMKDPSDRDSPSGRSSRTGRTDA